MDYSPLKQLRWIGFTLLCLGTLYSLGFAYYRFTLPTTSPINRPPELTGLAVFTGGSGRIAYGLQLAAQAPHTPLLISGIHPQVSNQTLTEQFGIVLGASPAITLDRTATTTRENIQMLKQWPPAQIGRVGIITAHYHAPRVSLLLHQMAPELQPTILVTVPSEVPPSFYLREYTKVLLAAVKII